jgi:hypothetical protein
MISAAGADAARGETPWTVLIDADFQFIGERTQARKA